MRKGLRLKTILSTIALLLAGCYLFFSVRGPSGVPVILEKRRQIRELQEQNADLQREIQEKKERIRRLSDSSSDQELLIREQLKLLKKDETTFVIQDQRK